MLKCILTFFIIKFSNLFKLIFLGQPTKVACQCFFFGWHIYVCKCILILCSNMPYAKMYVNIYILYISTYIYICCNQQVKHIYIHPSICIYINVCTDPQKWLKANETAFMWKTCFAVTFAIRVLSGRCLLFGN